LVNLKFSFQTPKKIYFILDYVNGGELFYHLRKYNKFTEDKVKFYAAEITLALEHLHSIGVIYRDLKPENVLLDSTGHIRLTDFGLSKQGEVSREGLRLRTKTFCGTPEYLAPEVLAGQDYGPEIDWWSLGNIMFELYTGVPPFYCKNQNEMYNRIMHESPIYPEEISTILKDLMTKLLERDPRQRLNGSGVKKHPFFKGIKWNKLVEKKIKPPIIPKVKGEDDTSHVDTEFTGRRPVDSVSETAEEQQQQLTTSMDSILFSEFSFISVDEIRKSGETRDKQKDKKHK